MGSKVASMSSAAQVAFTTGPILEEAEATTSKIEPRPLRLIYDWRLNRLIIINIIISPREEPSFLKKKFSFPFFFPFSLSLSSNIFSVSSEEFESIQVVNERKKRGDRNAVVALFSACAPARLNV